jgi:hypothetical protein
LCKEAESGEGPAVDAVCAEFTKLFPSIKLDPDCKTVVDSLWQSGLAFCPQQPTTPATGTLATSLQMQLQQQAKLPQSVVKDIEKWLCKQAQAGEGPAVDAVCAEFTKLFPSIKLDPDCKTVVDSFLQSGLALCPEQPTTGTPATGTPATSTPATSITQPDLIVV